MDDADEKRKRQVLETMKGLLKDGGPDIGKANAFTKRLAKAKSSFAKEHTKGKKGTKHKLVAQAKTEPQKLEKTEVAKPSVATPTPPKLVATTTPVTPQRQAVNMELAQSGSAFSVATLSQLANRQPQIEQTGPNEVTISLH